MLVRERVEYDGGSLNKYSNGIYRLIKYMKEALSGWIMKNIFGKALVALILFYTCTLSAATDEFVAEVIEVDIKTSEITLLYMHMRKVEFRLAYDVRIRLANGQKGAVANLRKGNKITAVGDPDKQVLYMIQVLN